MSKRLRTTNSLLNRRSQVNNLAAVIDGMTSVLEVTYGRINHFCQYHGVTTLSNERISGDLNKTPRAINSHLRGLAHLGLLLPVYGARKDPHAEFGGFSRWLFTPSRHFRRAFRQAVRGSDKEPLSFVGSIRNKVEDVSERVWRFLAVQEALFPGTVDEAAAVAFAEFGRIPAGVPFEGRFDAQFFAVLIGAYAPPGVEEKFNLRVLNEPLPLSFPGKPERKSEDILSTREAARCATAQGGDSSVPGESSGVPHNKEHLSNGPLELMGPRARRLAKAHPEASVVLCELFPNHPYEEWPSIVHRRFNKQLANRELKISELELIRDYLPEKLKTTLNPELLSNVGARIRVLHNAANYYRIKELDPLQQWFELRSVSFFPNRSKFMDFGNYGVEYFPVGWLECVQGQTADFSQIPNRYSWAKSMLWYFLTPLLKPRDSMAAEAPNVARVLGPRLMFSLCLYPDLNALALSFEAELGDRFESTLGFSPGDLRLAFMHNTAMLRERVRELQKFKWVDSFIPPDETAPDTLSKLPDPSDFTITL